MLITIACENVRGNDLEVLGRTLFDGYKNIQRATILCLKKSQSFVIIYSSHLNCQRAIVAANIAFFHA